MEIKLHFTPEKPEKSCRVLAMTMSTVTQKISMVADTSYSTQWGAFFMRDEDESMPYCTQVTNKMIFAWAYMDEIEEGVFDEINR